MLELVDTDDIKLLFVTVSLDIKFSNVNFFPLQYPNWYICTAHWCVSSTPGVIECTPTQPPEGGLF